jgi:hypothetical protein
VVSIPRKYLWKVDTFRSVVGMSSLVAEIALAAIIEADLEKFFFPRKYLWKVDTFSSVVRDTQLKLQK